MSDTTRSQWQRVYDLSAGAMDDDEETLRLALRDISMIAELALAALDIPAPDEDAK